METDFINALKKLEELKYFNKKTANKFVLDYLNEKEDYQDNFAKISELLKNLIFCPRCGSIRMIDYCQNCQKDSEKLFIFQTLNDAISLETKNILVEKSFILNFKNKNDFLSTIRINTMLERMEEFLNLEANSNLKEFYLIFAPSYELEILKKIFSDFLKKNHKKIILKSIPLGIPMNSDLKYYDEKMIQKVIDKSERIN